MIGTAACSQPVVFIDGRDGRREDIVAFFAVDGNRPFIHIRMRAGGGIGHLVFPFAVQIVMFRAHPGSIVRRRGNMSDTADAEARAVFRAGNRAFPINSQPAT